MTASEVAQLFHARRIGKGKWQARCTVHKDDSPSLSIKEGKRGVLIQCFAGCSKKDILASVGLTFSSLFYDAEISAEKRQRLKDEERLEWLERRWGLALWLSAIDNGKTRYWQVAGSRLRREVMDLTFKLYPDRKRIYDIYVKIKRMGWDAMWEAYWKDH